MESLELQNRHVLNTSFYLFWNLGNWGNTQIYVVFLFYHTTAAVVLNVFMEVVFVYILFVQSVQSPWPSSERGNVWIFANDSWCKNSEETTELQPQYKVQNVSYLLEAFADSYSEITTGICAGMCPPRQTRPKINICKDKENI